MTSALTDQWPLKPRNVSTRPVCVFLGGKEMDIPFRDEPEDKQNQGRFGDEEVIYCFSL